MIRCSFLSGTVLLGAAFFVLASSAQAQGFGRWGRIHEDGLLTLNVSPNSCETPPARGATLRVEWGASKWKTDARPTRIDDTEKRLRIAQRSGGEPLEVRYSLLYPGVSLTVHGRELFAFQKENRQEASIQIEELPRLADGSRVRLIRRKDAPAPPLLMVTGTGKPYNNGLTAPSVIGLHLADSVVPVRFVTPWGVRPIAASVPLAALRGEAIRWAKLPVPVRLRHVSRLAPDGKTVTVTETFTGTIAPLPPVLSFARQNGYPVKVEGSVVYTQALTKWGAFAYVPGHTLRYTLPVPPTEERGYIRPETVDLARVALLNSFVGHLGGDWASNGVDLAYAGMTNAQMAAPYLDTQQRAAVAAAWKKYLPLAFLLPPYKANTAKHPWNTATEPFTKQNYLWTYRIDGPGGYNYDLDWGNALPLYGLYKYAQFTGDWAMVRRFWPAVGRIYLYFDLGDDWAWMTVVNADHGYSTGTGDPLCAYYAATIACLKMARAIGDKEAETRFAVRAARVAVPTVARFWYTDYGRKWGMLSPKGAALGFQEIEGFTRSDYGESPWWPTTLLSGDGALPEVFTLYREFAPRALRLSEDRYSAAYPQWFNGSYTYPFAASYNGNGMYVTFPHIYARAAVLNEPTARLWQYVDGAKTNRNNAWIGPNVVAELLSRSAPLTLTEWQPAAYRGGAAHAETVTLFFVMRETGSWRMTARLRSDWRPAAVRVNGIPAPFTVRGDLLTVKPAHRFPTGGFTVLMQARSPLSGRKP